MAVMKLMKYVSANLLYWFQCLTLLIGLILILIPVKIDAQIKNSANQYVEFFANYANYDKPNTQQLKYKFLYYISDDPSKVHLLHREERRGDYVTGQYSLLEANGYVRNVRYEVDGKNGYNSVVQTRTPHVWTHFRLTNRMQAPEAIQHKQPVAFIL